MRSVCLVLAILSLATPASAEFVMTSPSPADSAADSPEPPTAPGPVGETQQKRRPPRPDPVLTGFGDQIPLSFAVRQIVPKGYRVAFAETVDRNAVVDWRAGKPWRATLADAVKPLGLAVSVAGAQVTIGPVSAPR